MSKQVPVQSSSFSIRFRPAAVSEQRDELGIAEDVCDINDSSSTHNGSCETVMFERVTNEEESAHSSDRDDSRPVPHSVNLWQDSQAILSHSAPASAITSPMSPSTGSVVPFMYEKMAMIKPLASSVPLAEKFLAFSGLKEKLDKLSTESRDRKMKRSGSADSAKIASILAEPSVPRSHVVKTEVCSENTDSVQETDEQMPEVSEEFIEEDSSAVCSSDSIHRSASSTEVTKADIVSTSATKLKSRASLGNEYRQEPVIMSRLLSSSGQPENRQNICAVTNVLQLSESSQNINTESRHAIDARQFRKPKRLIFTARFRYVFSFLIAAVAYIIIPMPPYIAGMLAGAFLSAVSILFYQRLTRSRHSTTVLSRNMWSSTSITADIKESKNVDGKFQGWMNQLSNYNAAEFHISDTYSVYVTLEFCTLRLQTPKHGVPKRAICDEYVPTAGFVRQRHFDLEGARVYLLPHGLVNKRLWSKKYPICIALCNRSRPTDLRHMSDASSKTTVLYLFARACRDKEEWYRRFLYAARGMPLPTRLSDVVAQTLSMDQTSDPPMSVSWQKHHRNPSTDSTSSPVTEECASAMELDYSRMLPEHNLIDYSRYMSAVMPPPSPGPAPRDDQSPVSMTWLNALIGRLFLDFLREKYWAEKMRDKIQNKLCKMHMPHFINQLSVTGIELGCAVPSIRHVSEPYLDDRGFWLDMDIDYSGGFCLSLETKCNLMRLKYASCLSPSCVNDENPTKPARCGAMCSDEEDSAESTTDEDNMEDNTSQDAADER